ncbi:AraC family transcriptional regulator [Maridesulfovibrio sp.]|uniref:helix-turn-helix domain-containing protein n=1 Tax=Maridesulfovibrio sp. TaxID=2795000 RepID=UPI002A18A2DA|nr:AraC family transcriptional regulator [Maridesulfovibrio sp.]
MGDKAFSYQKKNRYIDFGFFLEGGMVNELSDTPLGPLHVENVAGSGGFGFLDEISGVVKPVSPGRVRSLHIHSSPELLHELLDSDMDYVNDDLKLALENNTGHNFLLHDVLEPVVQAAASELFYGLAGGRCGRVYLEGKALELIGLQVMKCEESAGRQGYGLSSDEMDKIRDIREHLEEKFDCPPSMTELSRTHMISIGKIRTGFNLLYGMSVFAFLKEYRMSKAKLLLQGGDMNVSEAAWALGYTNLSHFSAAFKKKYGVLPKKFLTSARNKRILS